MKKIFFLFAGLLSLTFNPASAPAKDFDDNYRFIYYAVMEGCYEDGLTNGDVSQILLTNTNTGHVHFIYACPICMPTIHALEAYRARPQHLFGMKTRSTTFGPGLSEEQKKQLYSENPTERLMVINGLMQNWIMRRMTELRLSDPERSQLKQNLEKMRQEGMKMLKQTMAARKAEAKTNPEMLKPWAFEEVQQCAVCNGACSMKLKP